MENKKSEPLKILIYIILLLLSCIVIIHIENQYASYVSMHGKQNVINELSSILSNSIQHLKKYPFDFKITGGSIKWCLFYIAFVLFIVYYNISSQKKTAFGKEKGSARWATAKEEKQFRDKKNDENNMILTDTVQMSMNTRQHRKNCNLLVIGGSGTGKSRFVAKPNLMQANCSFVVTDPKGELLKDTAMMFEKLGYVVKVFNLKEPEYSCCYNPFAYIRNDDEVFILVNQLIKNTTEKGKGGGDPFWEKAELLLIESLFFFLLHPITVEDFYEYSIQDKEIQSLISSNQITLDKYYDLMSDVIDFLKDIHTKTNIGGLMDLLQFATVKEEDDDYKSSLDLIFEILKWRFDRENKTCIAYTQYQIYKKAAGKTLKSILISVGARLQAFNLSSIRNLTNTDTLELDKLGDRKTVLFAVLPDDDKSMNFIVAMMYNQLFRTLYYKADFGTQNEESVAILPKSKESFEKNINSLMGVYEKMEVTIGDKHYSKLLKTVLEHEKNLKNEYGIDLDFKLLLKNHERTKAVNIAKENLSNLNQLMCDVFDNRSKYIHDYMNGKSFNKSVIEKLYDIDCKEKNYISKLKAIARFDEWASDRMLKYGSAEKLKELNMHFNNLVEQLEAQIEELNGFSHKQRKTDAYIQRKKLIDDTKLEIEDIRTVLKNEYELDIPQAELNKSSNKWEIYKKDFSEKVYSLSGVSNGSGRLDIHVRFILDEFANLGEIPDFEQKISTMRSREISVTVIIQTISQLKETYKDNWETIAGNCDSWLFIGGTEEQTTEKISKKLGKATIDVKNSSRSKGKSGSYSTSWQKDGRELLDPAEVGKIPDDKCILFVRGANPFYTNKYRIERHKRYKMLADVNPSFTYPYKERFNTELQAKQAENKIREKQMKFTHKNKEDKINEFVAQEDVSSVVKDNTVIVEEKKKTEKIINNDTFDMIL